MNQQPENVSGESVPKPGSEASPALPFPGQERTEDLVGTLRMIKKFNRSTTWVASGLLGSVIFAALMVAFQERNSEPAGNNSRQAKQVGDVELLTDHSASLASVANVPENTASVPENTASVTPGPIKSDDQGLASVGKDEPTEKVNVIGWSPTPRHDVPRRLGSTRSKTTSRTSARPKYDNVKMRLLALWHQSLAHNEKARSWIRFSKVKEGEKEKVSYTARANH